MDAEQVPKPALNAAEFGDHMWKFNSYGFTLVSICFGNEVGLFDLIMDEDRPMTSVEIADKADMKERYVREWLGNMVAAQIILLDGDQYSIPKERHDTIRGAAAWGHGAVAWVKRFDQTKECFRKNGPWGNNYDCDEEFWSFFGGFREKTGDGFVEKAVLPSIEALPEFDINGKLASGINVLDMSCGTGQFTKAFARRFPNSTFTGIDYCEKPLRRAEEHPDRKAITNLTFKRGDVYDLGETAAGQYDFITMFDALHDLPDPSKALANMSQALKPEGKLMIMDFIPHSEQKDNVGDLAASMFYSCSIFCCLQNSMLAEPRTGFGTCWGKERMTKTISEVVTIEKTFELPLYHCLFVCSKK